MTPDELLSSLSFHRKEYRRLSALAGAQGIFPPSEAETELKAAKLYKLICEYGRDIFAVFNTDGINLYCSPSIKRFGYEQEEIVGKSAYLYVHPDDLGNVAEYYSNLDAEPAPIRFRFVNKDGTQRWVEDVSRVVKDGTSEYIVSIIRDIDARKSEEEKIRVLAEQLDDTNKQLLELTRTDPLTGIGNRRMFIERLSTMLAEAERGRQLSVLILDLDNFKQFNDTYGHLAGDDALVAVAASLNQIIRKSDCFCRYGGEEFVVATGTGLPGSLILAEKLRSAVEDTKTGYRNITTSIGLAEYMPGDSAHSLVAKADMALYNAKSQGKNMVTSFTSAEPRLLLEATR